MSISLYVGVSHLVQFETRTNRNRAFGKELPLHSRILTTRQNASTKRIENRLENGYVNSGDGETLNARAHIAMKNRAKRRTKTESVRRSRDRHSNLAENSIHFTKLLVVNRKQMQRLPLINP
jgi:hypothetical protein